MTDITKLSREQIYDLGAAYETAALVFDTEPTKASEKKQKKIRKWLFDHPLLAIDTVTQELDNQAFFSLLKKCLDQRETLERKKKERLEADIAEYDGLTRHALTLLLENEYFPDLSAVGEDVCITVDETAAYRIQLTLKNVASVPKNKSNLCWEHVEMVLDKKQNRFRLRGKVEKNYGEGYTHFSMSFESPEATVSLFNPCSSCCVPLLGNAPWELLGLLSQAVLSKADIPGDFLNEKEAALLPLLRELTLLPGWRHVDDEETVSFEGLKALLKRFGHKKAKNKLDALEKLSLQSGRFFKKRQRLVAHLCKIKYAPLWKEIYERIAQAEAEYPHEADTVCEQALLCGIREEIQAKMEAKGYSGRYPDFVKKGSVKGIRLVASYDDLYFVFRQKRARFYIRCFENAIKDESLDIDFLCGTAFLKKGEAEGDVFDCLFHAKGKRLFENVTHTIPLHPQKQNKADDLDLSLSIAAKSAECQALTKEERIAFYGENRSRLKLFWLVFLLAGGLFAVGYTLFLMALTVIEVTIAESFAAALAQLKDWFWLISFVFSWIAFGGSMGLIIALAHRK